MWNLSAGLDWDTISQLSQQWANRYELTLARDFVERLDTLPEGETGRLLFQVDGSDEASQVDGGRAEQRVEGQVDPRPGLPDWSTRRSRKGPRSPARFA